MTQSPQTPPLPLYPLALTPALHVKVWGGRRLETLLHKSLPDDSPYGEAWEMHDTATIANGALAGWTVGEALAHYGHDLVGIMNDPAVGMPLLAKFLDAQDWLSVQVHPNDAQAAQFEGEPRGKTEAWIVIDATPGARLVCAVQPGTTAEALRAAIHENRLEDLLVYAEVRAGDVLLNHPGGIHALGPGILIYEIQQSSDITYRLYDWGRMGLDGNPRALHIEKSIAVAQTKSIPPITHIDTDSHATFDIVTSEYFITQHYPLDQTPVTLDTHRQTFHILTVIGGVAQVETSNGAIALEMGETALIPAVLGAYHMRASEGDTRVLVSFQPSPGE